MEITKRQIADMLFMALDDLKSMEYYMDKWDETDKDVYYTWATEHKWRAHGIIDTVNHFINPYMPKFSIARTWEMKEFCEKY